MKKCHKADHRELVDLRDAYRDVVLEREQLRRLVETYRMTTQQGPATLAPTEYAPGGYVSGPSVSMRIGADEHLFNQAGQCVRGPHEGCPS